MQAVIKWLNKYKSVFLLVFAGFLLLFAQSAYWVNHTIFDKGNFTSITNSVLDTESSRQAVASTIVDKALEDRPVLSRTISDQSTQLIAGLLGTDLARQAISTVIDRTYTYLTSEDQQPIAIDLGAIKTPIAGLISFAEQRGREVEFDPEAIPDSIELFDPSGLPDIYSYSVMMLWLGPISWLLAIGLLAAYVYRGRRVYAKRVYIVGAVIIVSSVIGLLAGPVVPPPLAAQMPVIGLREVTHDLISAFLSPFIRQMWMAIGFTVIALTLFNLRFTLIGLAQRAVPRSKAETAARPPKKPSKKKS